MKNCYIIIFLFLSCYVSEAQNKFITVHGGPKVGIITVVPQYKLWFTDKLEFTLEAPPYSAGAFAEFGLGRHFAVQLEGLSEQFVFAWKYGQYSIIEKVSCIDVPVMVKFKLGGFALHAGYQWSFLNFAERKMDQYGPDDPYMLDKIYEYGWHNANQMYAEKSNAFLVGLEYTTRPGLGFSVRYTKGLTDITVADLQNSIYVESDEIYNSYVTVSGYWSFGKRR